MHLTLKEIQNDPHIDIEAVETCIRSSMLHVGSLVLEKLLNAHHGTDTGKQMRCGNGHTPVFIGYRYKEVVTVLGRIRLRRRYYYDHACHRGWCPKDRALDIEGTALSPGMRRIMSRVGALRSFGCGEEDIKELAGIDVTAKEIERISHHIGEEVKTFLAQYSDAAVPENHHEHCSQATTMYLCMDGTGVPVVRAETIGRKGKGEDGQAKTREAKLGCIFTQTTVDSEGNPVRDEDSTSYVGAIETVEEFTHRIVREGRRRGATNAQKLCIIGDGAPWIWNLADEYFYGATQIIDLYHARQHYWTVAHLVFATEKKQMYAWAKKRREELDDGKVEQVINAIAHLCPATKDVEEKCEKEMKYFYKNRERMRYNRFRTQDLFVGSGVLEAGCRTVIGQRLKQSGMHWSVKGANSIIALRCCLLSHRWEDFWAYRTAA